MAVIKLDGSLEFKTSAKPHFKNHKSSDRSSHTDRSLLIMNSTNRSPFSLSPNAVRSYESNDPSIVRLSVDPLNYRAIGGAPAGYKPPQQASDQSLSSAGQSTDAGTGASPRVRFTFGSPGRFKSKIQMLKEEGGERPPMGPSKSTSKLLTVNVIKPQVIPNSKTSRGISSKSTTSITKNFIMGLEKLNTSHHKIYLDPTAV